jgi:hypothetical protein
MQGDERERTAEDVSKNREGLVSPGQVWEITVYGPDGVRHGGGVTLLQALVRNVGTRRSDAKGDVQVEAS